MDILPNQRPGLVKNAVNGIFQPPMLLNEGQIRVSRDDRRVIQKTGVFHEELLPGVGLQRDRISQFGVGDVLAQKVEIATFFGTAFAQI